MESVNPVKYREFYLRFGGLSDVIKIIQSHHVTRRGEFDKHGYRRACIKKLHAELTYLHEFPRRLQGGKLGLRKRFALAAEYGFVPVPQEVAG